MATSVNVEPTGYLDYTRPDGTVEKLAWTDPAVYEERRLAYIATQPPSPPLKRAPILLSEEVWEAVQEYYRLRGERVPPEEAKACVMAVAEERRACARPPTPPPAEPVGADGKRKHISGMPLEEDDPKPYFEGQPTPEFWAWARRQKARKDAERAAQGLPPLPTAREKAAAKAAKEKERAAKEAEKKEKERAKVAAAAAKLAAKEEKRAAAEAKAAAKSAKAAKK
jgi:hypothetical protein